MSIKSYVFSNFLAMVTKFRTTLNLTQKCIVIFSLFSLCAIFIGLLICDVGYFLSFFIAFFSFVILIVASIYSINKKVQKKILEARQKAELDSMESNNVLKTDSNLKIDSIAQKDSINLQTDSKDKKDSITQNPTQNSKENTSKENTSKENKKKILKFLDISKLTLGFELSFSFARIVAFFIMILGFILLIISHTFHALIYILGIFIASLTTILFLFLF